MAEQKNFTRRLGRVFEQTMSTLDCSRACSILDPSIFCVMAGKFGYVDVLDWLISYSCPVEPINICRKAAKNGHLDVIKWCMKDDPDGEWQDERVCKSAVSGGQLKILEFLRMNGCPWDIEKCKVKAKNRNFTEIYNWIEKNSDTH